MASTPTPRPRCTRYRPLAALAVTLPLLAPALTACSSSSTDSSTWQSDRPTASEARDADALRGVERAERRIAAGAVRDTSAGARAPVVLNGTPIPWTDLHPYLAEASGRAALDEALLDRLIDRELSTAGVSISKRDVDAEYSDFVAVLRQNVAGRGATTEAVVADMRRALGLGPKRFEATLARNAKLRALVRERVTITPEDIQLAHQINHGQRHRIRLITTASQRDASAIRRQLAGLTGDPLRIAFASAAMQQSTDQSAAAGGLIEPISTVDPAYPSAIGQAVARLSTGSLSPVVALPDAYALIFVEEQIPPTGRSLGQTRSDLERDLRARRERLAMERLATQLLDNASITVLDPSLEWTRRSRG